MYLCLFLLIEANPEALTELIIQIYQSFIGIIGAQENCLSLKFIVGAQVPAAVTAIAQIG